MTIVAVIFGYFIMGLMTFALMKTCETEEFSKFKDWQRVSIRLTYILFWPFYIIFAFLSLLFWCMEWFIKALIE